MTRQSAEVYLGERLSATGDVVDDMREDPQVLYPAGVGKLASRSRRCGQPLLHGGGKTPPRFGRGTANVVLPPGSGRRRRHSHARVADIG
jgi:hypothetical protein